MQLDNSPSLPLKIRTGNLHREDCRSNLRPQQNEQNLRKLIADSIPSACRQIETDELLLFSGAELLERWPDDRDHVQYKLLVGTMTSNIWKNTLALIRSPAMPPFHTRPSNWNCSKNIRPRKKLQTHPPNTPAHRRRLNHHQATGRNQTRNIPSRHPHQRRPAETRCLRQKSIRRPQTHARPTQSSPAARLRAARHRLDRATGAAAHMQKRAMRENVVTAREQVVAAENFNF
jgi:hypothetical protein